MSINRRMIFSRSQYSNVELEKVRSPSGQSNKDWLPVGGFKRNGPFFRTVPQQSSDYSGIVVPEPKSAKLP